MSANLAPAISHPNYHRACHNVGAAPIPKYYIAKVSGTGLDDGALGDAAANTFLGVAVEDIPVGATKSVQRDGRMQVMSGAAIASRGLKLTVNATGRAVPVADPADEVIGFSVTTAAGAGEIVAVERTAY